MSEKKINTFTSSNATRVFMEAKKALQPLCEQYGLNIGSTSANYRNGKMDIKFELCVNDMGNGTSFAKEEFCNYAVHFGLNPSDYGKAFFFGKEVYVISGISLRARRYPIITVRVRDNTQVRFSQFCMDDLYQNPVKTDIKEIKKGDIFACCKQSSSTQGKADLSNLSLIRAGEDAHQNLDEPDTPWIVYDEDGNSYFAEDVLNFEKALQL